jgi:hypothetical protein
LGKGRGRPYRDNHIAIWALASERRVSSGEGRHGPTRESLLGQSDFFGNMDSTERCSPRISGDPINRKWRARRHADASPRCLTARQFPAFDRTAPHVKKLRQECSSVKRIDGQYSLCKMDSRPLKTLIRRSNGKGVQFQFAK